MKLSIDKYQLEKIAVLTPYQTTAKTPSGNLRVKIVNIYQIRPQEYQTDIVLLLKSQNPGILKPEFYDIQGKMVFLFQKNNGLSLSDLFAIYRNKESFFSYQDILLFIKKVLNHLILSQKQFSHTNIKPSNIFRDQAGNWYLSEANLISDKANYTYMHSMIKQTGDAKQLMSTIKKVKKDYGFCLDLFSIGIILVQMCTLCYDQLNCFKNLGLRQNLDARDQLYRKISTRYGNDIIYLIQRLINAQPDWRPKKIYADLKQFLSGKGGYKSEKSVDCKPYEIMQSFKFNQFQQYLKKNYSSRLMLLLDIFRCNDPNMGFFFKKIDFIQQFLQKINFKQKQEIHALELYKSCNNNGYFFYMPLLKSIFSCQQLVKTVIIKKIDCLGMSFQTFFQKKAGPNKLWQVNQIIRFLQNQIHINYSYQEIRNLMQKWSKNSSALNFKQLKEILYQSSDKTEVKATELKQGKEEQFDEIHKVKEFISILQQKLKKQKKNLFAFFNQQDPKNRFEVGVIIKEKIFKIMGRSNDVLKHVENCWLIGGVGASRQLLKYLRVLKLHYSKTDIFKECLRAIVSKENKSFNKIFNDYANRSQSWTIRQFQKLNDVYDFQFQTRELNQILRSLDTSKDGSISRKELIVKFQIDQYDFQLVTQIISQKLLAHKKNKESFSVLNFFIQATRQKELQFQSVNQLQQALKSLQIQITQKNLMNYYNQFKPKRNRISIIAFAKLFTDVTTIFKDALQFITTKDKQSLGQIFKGHATKGMKWTFNSLKEVCQTMEFAFVNQQLQQIWRFLDQHTQGNITFQQFSGRLGRVGQLMKASNIQQAQQQVNSTSGGKHLANSRKNLTSSKFFSAIHYSSQTFIERVSKYAQTHDLMSMFMEQDKQRNMSVSKPVFMRCLRKTKLQGNQMSLNQIFKQFQKKGRFEYVNMLFEIAISDKTKISYIQKIIKQAMLYQQCSLKELTNNLETHEWTKRNLKQFLELIDIRLSEDTFERVWSALDKDGSNTLDYYQFASALGIQMTAEQMAEYHQSKKVYATQNKKPARKYNQWQTQQISKPKIPLAVQKSLNIQANQIIKRAQSYVTPVKNTQSNATQKDIPFDKIIEREGFLFTDFDLKQKGFLTQNQLMECLISKKGYSLSRRQAQLVAKDLLSSGKVSIQFLRNKFQKAQIRHQSPLKMQTNMSFFITSEKKQRRKPNSYSCRQLIGSIKKNFQKKQNISQLFQFYYKKGEECITAQAFQSKTVQILKAQKISLSRLSQFLDPLNTQFISHLSFKLNFTYQPVQNQHLIFPAEIQSQLNQVFSKADKDKSKSIQISELPFLLQQIGMNISQKQASQYFKQMDKDRSGDIDFNQFKQFIQQKVFRKLNTQQGIYSQIKNQLNLNDLNNERAVSVDQLFHVLKKLTLPLTQIQVITLFFQLDKDRQNLIKIDDFLKALNMSQNMTKNTKIIIYKIKLGKSFNFKEIKACFTFLPGSYTLSQLSQNIKSSKSLPSSLVLPRTKAGGIYFDDLMPAIQIQKLGQNYILQQGQSTGLQSKIAIQIAQGVPIPNQKIIARPSILQRKVLICLFDQDKQQYFGNSLVLKAKWQSSIQDQWLFKEDNKYSLSSIFYLKWHQYTQKMAFKLLVFQLVITVQVGSRVLDINCGTASLPLRDVFNRNQRTKINIQGGLPGKKRVIKLQDSTARRTGLMGFIKGPTVSSILLISTQVIKNQPQSFYFLPKFGLCFQRATDLIRHFREFQAYLYFLQRMNSNIIHNRLIRSFMAALDCSDVFPALVQSWNKHCFGTIKNGQNSRELIKKVCNQLLLLFSKQKFRFIQQYTSMSCLGIKVLQQDRVKLVAQFADCIKALAKGEKKSRVGSGSVQIFKEGEKPDWLESALQGIAVR